MKRYGKTVALNASAPRHAALAARASGTPDGTFTPAEYAVMRARLIAEEIAYEKAAAAAEFPGV